MNIKLVNVISSFDGDYDFLSNFHIKPMFYNNRWWNSLEHAYQASKTFNSNEQEKIQNAKSPGVAKRLGSKVTLQSDWDSIKLDRMRELLVIKFSNPELKQKLLETGNAKLIEGNSWKDTFWGMCNGRGENWLGKLLMEVRQDLLDNP